MFAYFQTVLTESSHTLCSSQKTLRLVALQMDAKSSVHTLSWGEH